MKDYKYPIFYIDRSCVNCGAKNSVIPINKFGYPAKNNELYPMNIMKCKECGREYYIRWDKDEKDNYNEQIAVSFNEIDLFMECLKQRLDNK